MMGTNAHVDSKSKQQLTVLQSIELALQIRSIIYILINNQLLFRSSLIRLYPLLHQINDFGLTCYK